MYEMNEDAMKSAAREVEAVMSRMMELASENSRLQRLVAELLMKNQKLRGTSAVA